MFLAAGDGGGPNAAAGGGGPNAAAGGANAMQAGRGTRKKLSEAVPWNFQYP